MSGGPIAFTVDPVEVVVERRAPGGPWVPVFQLRDHECPLGVVPEYHARRAEQCAPISCTDPVERRQLLAEAIAGSCEWASADVVGAIVEAVLPFVRL